VPKKIKKMTRDDGQYQKNIGQHNKILKKCEGIAKKGKSKPN
jgi:hypothetical protein